MAQNDDQAKLSTEQPLDQETAPDNPAAARIEKILISYGEQKFQEFARYRFAEEREWYESALFEQRRQWLKWNDTTRRWALIRNSQTKPKPMPVTNYFAKAINDNANQLQKVTIVATPHDDSDVNRRGAEYAEKSIDAIDEESGFNVLRPLLAKHVVLWGMGITKDTYDATASAGQVKLPNPTIKTSWALSCGDCGQTSELGDEPPINTPAANKGEDAAQMGASLSGQDLEEDNTGSLPAGDQRCPKCGSMLTTPYKKQRLIPAGTSTFTRGKVITEVPTIFEVYLPRDCRNPNLAKTIVQRSRKRLGELRRVYQDKAAKIKAEAPHDVHEIYMEGLRSLVNYNYMHEQTQETTTVTDVWSDWDDLPKKVQDELTEFWQSDDAEDGEQNLEMAQNCGIFVIYSGGTVLAWGPNPTWGEKPYTFYLWELDPASVYPKGLAIHLTPLQKRLNRLDSLIELAMMCNAAGKWIWPRTQTGEKPSGSPNEVIPYDVLGEGKNKPEFVAPEPISQSAWVLRQGILGDFQQIGNTLSVQQGNSPGGARAFRAIAYLGAKAEESQGTQRMLWELGHQLRYRKVVRMAAEFWNDNRKAKVAGYNGKFGMVSLTGELLKGDYEITFVPDSSRPRLIGEKQQAVAAALQAGLIDPTDSATREYLANLLRLDQVNMVDHLQYTKAERDLEMLKTGKVPQESPFQKWDIFLKVFANFTLTEEFEELDPPIQQLVLSYTQRMSEQLAQASAPGPGAGVAPLMQAAGDAIAQMSGQGNNPLNAVPGQDVAPQSVQQQAGKEGAQVGAQLP